MSKEIKPNLPLKKQNIESKKTWQEAIAENIFHSVEIKLSPTEENMREYIKG